MDFLGILHNNKKMLSWEFSITIRKRYHGFCLPEDQMKTKPYYWTTLHSYPRHQTPIFQDRRSGGPSRGWLSWAAPPLSSSASWTVSISMLFGWITKGTHFHLLIRKAYFLHLAFELLCQLFVRKLASCFCAKLKTGLVHLPPRLSRSQSWEARGAPKQIQN